MGVNYTIFSEWLNIIVRSSLAYSEPMPVVPIVRIGLPALLQRLLQWILIPTIGFVACIQSAQAKPESVCSGQA